MLQGLLYCHDYNPNGFDGSYGSGGGTGCLTATNQYKADNSIAEYPDTAVGAVGAETMASLCWKPYRLQDLADGIYYIRNYYSGHYMTVENGGETSGTNVYQYSFHGSDIQKWYVKKLENGYYSIRPCHNLDYGLDLFNTSGNSNIDIWACSRPPYSVPSYCKWRLLDVGDSGDDDLYKISPYNDLDTCAAITGSVSGANIAQEEYNNSVHEKWIFEYVSAFTPITSINIIDAQVKTATGERSFLSKSSSPSNATPNQIFWSSSDISVATVDKFGWVTAKNPGIATISVENFNRTKSDSCTIIVGAIPEGNYFIRNKYLDDHYIAFVDNTIISDSIRMTPYLSGSGNGAQVWSFQLNDNGYYRITNLFNNEALCAENVSNYAIISQEETQYRDWKIYKTSSGAYKIVLKDHESYGFSSNYPDLVLKTFSNDSDYQDEWTFDRLRLNLNIYYDESFVERKDICGPAISSYSPTMLIRELLKEATTFFKDNYDMDIYINQITPYHSCVDDCPSPLDSICSCVSISAHHTDFSRFVNYAIDDPGGNTVNLYLTGHKMCLWQITGHSSSTRGLCYNNSVIGVMLLNDLDGTAKAILHEIGHLFYVDDHEESLIPPCTYNYEDQNMICPDCREILLFHMGKYKEN